MGLSSPAYSPFKIPINVVVSSPSKAVFNHHWFVVYSKPRQEAEATRHLERLGFTTFLPRVRARRRQRGRWREIIEPMFPRYLFLRAAPGRDNLRPVHSTRGVVGLVRFGNRLQSVPEVVINDLRKLCGEEEGALTLPSPLMPGNRFCVLEGPFARREVELLSENGEQRAQVLLELFGRAHAIDLPVDLLVPA